MQETPFECLGHFVVVSVQLAGIERRFILDSGIGLTVVRASIDDCVPTGSTFMGKRMSGQEVPVPLATVPSLAFSGIEDRDAEVGLLDMGGFPEVFAEIDGFLSLAFLRRQPFTIDYRRRTVRDGTDAVGTLVPIRVRVDGPAVTAFMALTIPGGRTIEVELDMGSDTLILDQRLAPEAGVRLDAAEVRREEGVDETGNRYVRSFARLEGPVYPADTPDLAQQDPEVMFQPIIYDGLLGHDFLNRHTVTWDLPRSEIRLQPAPRR